MNIDADTSTSTGICLTHLIPLSYPYLFLQKDKKNYFDIMLSLLNSIQNCPAKELVNNVLEFTFQKKYTFKMYVQNITTL